MRRVEICFFHMCHLETRSFCMRKDEKRFSQMCHIETRSFHVHIREMRTFQMRPAEQCTFQMSPFEICSVQIATTQIKPLPLLLTPAVPLSPSQDGQDSLDLCSRPLVNRAFILFFRRNPSRCRSILPHIRGEHLHNRPMVAG